MLQYPENGFKTEMLTNLFKKKKNFFLIHLFIVFIFSYVCDSILITSITMLESVFVCLFFLMIVFL